MVGLWGQGLLWEIWIELVICPKYIDPFDQYIDQMDIDPFVEPDKKDAQPDEHLDETIPFTPGGVIEGGTWEPEREQETSFGGKHLRMKVLREHVEGLYQKLSGKTGQTPEAFHSDDFEIRDGKLYYRDKRTPLMNKQGKLKYSPP